MGFRVGDKVKVCSYEKSREMGCSVWGDDWVGWNNIGKVASFVEKDEYNEYKVGVVFEENDLHYFVRADYFDETQLLTNLSNLDNKLKLL